MSQTEVNDLLIPQPSLQKASAFFLSLLLFLSPTLVSAKPSNEAVRFANKLSHAFQEVAEKITPSVVSISSRKSASNVSLPGMNSLPGPFRDFFGDEFLRRFGPPPGGGGQGGGMLPHGMGTGVIVDAEGHILTNDHVVSGADEVEVRLSDKRTYPATIVGTDPRTDLAVIKIDSESLTPAKLGESGKLKIGEWVVAAGNPFGLENSITAGIVSAKGRSIMGGGKYEDFIQTDAAINPGNSGGPLVNLNGEVVGINTAIFSKTGGYMGIGFAIPINMARNIMRSLIKDGRVIRGWLGVGIQNLTEEMAESFDYPSTEGALVGHLEEGGPGDKGGLQQGDIIIRFHGEKIKDTNQLRNLVAIIRPTTQVEVDIIREGRKKTLKIQIGELPSRLGGGQEKPAQQSSSAPDIGVKVEPLTEEIAQRLGSSKKYGLVVTEVRPGGIADRSGISVRDIILRVNSEQIKTVKDLNRLVTKSAIRRGIRVVVETQGMERFVFLRSKK